MVAMLGAKAPTGMPRWRSTRCLPKVGVCRASARAGEDEGGRGLPHATQELGQRRLEDPALPLHRVGALAQFRFH